MFFDGFDIYIAGTVLGVDLEDRVLDAAAKRLFISVTFVGMMLGSLVTGFLGDRFGRRFTYQFNLLMFGLASLAAAFAPNMTIADRLPLRDGRRPRRRKRRRLFDHDRIRAGRRPRQMAVGLMAVCVVTGLPIALLVASLVVPEFGWRRDVRASAASAR